MPLAEDVDVLDAVGINRDRLVGIVRVEAVLKQRSTDTLLAAVHVPTRRAVVELQRHRAASAIALLQARPL